MFPKGEFDLIFNCRVHPGERLSVSGNFLIMHSRRCASTAATRTYGLAMDICAESGTIIKIMRNGEEVRRYGSSD